LTQRNILSCIMGEYDPLGIISPALVRSKLMLRDLYGKEAKRGWDDALSREETQEWVERFSRQMVDGAAVFPRSVRPKEARGGPDLVGFADSSLQALCVAIYAVWDLQDESREARLLTAKCRVTPLHGTSIPRGELQALVVLLRLLVATAGALRHRARKVTVFSDSECTLAALKKSGALMRPYFANRVSEALMLLKELGELCEEGVEVRHVSGSLNPADLGTRGDVTLESLGQGSSWQAGPDFLTLVRTMGPSGVGGDDGRVQLEESIKFHVSS
jgi:hypothetical protein